jgi:hypothetical protein
MKQVFQFVLLTLVLLPGAAKALPYLVVGDGADSCGDWTKNRAQHDPHEGLELAWLEGFLSG